MKQKLFTFFLALVASVSAIYASNTQVDGIWYDFDSSTKTASVTYRGSWYNSYDDEYSGSVIIPETVTYYGTTYSVTSIGEEAFLTCSSLTSVTIPNSVTSIGEMAFRYCSSLTSVTIGESVTSIGDYAFEYCSKLTSVTIGESVTSIGANAFSSCESLTSVTIPNSVTSIGDRAFYYCSKLTSVTIGESVTSIGFAAFANCSSLTSITIPNSVTSIGKRAFYDCSSLTSVTIGESVTSIGESAFGGCSSLTSVTINSDAIVSKDYSTDDNISHIFGSQVTEYIIGNKVKGIGERAFYGCSSLTSVTIPNSVTSIGRSAFYSCSSLTSMTIPNSVTSIGYYAFRNCSSLTSVTIPNSVTSIEDYAFSDCSSLTSVTLPESVTSIGNYAFSDCSSLTSVTIPNSVTSIGDYAFSDCSSLTSITIPNSVTSIGGYAFNGCSSLTSVTINSNAIVSKAYSSYYNISHIFGSKVTEYIIGDDVKGIGNSAFEECSKLTSVTIGESVTSIGNYAFSDCSSLTSVTIPNSVTSIGSGAFYHCSSLTSITIPNRVTSIGEMAFSYCSSLTSVTIGESVTSIGESAFLGCSSLASVTIPESVTSIGNYAFSDCSSLTSVTIPNSVTSIGDYAFYGCSSLTSITCEAVISPTVGSGAFEGVDKSIPIYVPCGCVEAYKAANGWSDFTNIQEPLAEYSIKVDVNDNTMGTAKVDRNSACGNQISATPNIGYHFVQWSDGSTDAIRTLVLTQDTTLTAEFALTQSGQCGDSLYWELIDTTLHITGKGEMYDYESNTIPWKLLISSIKSLSVSEGTTSIGNRAFRDCSSLTSVTIPNSVTSIGSEAFNGCSSLTSVILTALSEEEFCKGQGNSLLYSKGVRCQREIQINGTKVTKFTIPNGVTSIGAAAFYYCSSLTSVTIGESVTSIGDDAFYSCSSLTSVTFPESVTSIGKSAFEGCSAIDSIVWNAKNGADASSLETAPFYAIRSQITSFTFGENVEHISAYLCDGMDKLTSMTIPNSVTSIGNAAFRDCSSLTSVTIGNGVTSIGKSAFEGCSSLTTVTTPNSLNTIGISAFEGCARLGEVSLGTGLEEIAANAFAGCTRLYDIYVYATYPPFAEESSFANYNVYVYVPCEYQRDYTLDIVWGKFKFIECIDSEDATTDGNVTVVPGFNDVTITWPTAENADSYSLVINKDNQPFCTLTFNAEGQLLNIAFAPSRDGNNCPAQYAEQAVNGYRFTVTGLTEATQYAYNITTKDAANNTIATYSGEFTTMGGVATSVEDILHSTTNCQKLLRNGNLVIIRDGKTYNAMGQEL